MMILMIMLVFILVSCPDRLIKAPVVDVALNGSRDDHKQKYQDVHGCKNLIYNGGLFNTKRKNPYNTQEMLKCYLIVWL